MADSFAAPLSAAALPAASLGSRHSGFIRITHWLTVLCFLALLVSGVEILISHPRFYWGEAGNVNTHPLFQLHIPASRSSVPTGYSYVLPDQNGWSRYLHFESAWLLVFTGIVYVASGLLNGYFHSSMIPAAKDLHPKQIVAVAKSHLRIKPLTADGGQSYNVLQRLTYLFVIFILFPLVIWTGLAMSPGIVSAFPATVTLLGGQQSARTVHFFVSIALVLFLFIHVLMVCIAGFQGRMRAMITGGRS